MSLLTVVKTPSVFLERVEPMLIENEAQNNLIVGLLYRATKLNEQLEDYFFAYMESNDEVFLSFLKTPNQKLILANSRQITLDEIKQVVEELLSLGISVPGIIGEKKIVNEFVSIWNQNTNHNATLDMEQLIYQLEVVNKKVIGVGLMRVASDQDIERITQWIYEFSLVTPDQLSVDAARNLAQESVHAGSIYLWTINNKVVSMARKARPSKNGIVVSLVYTPIEERKKGYASSLVATLSQHLLDEGYQFCSLYTDLSNPTSNHIYREIGYKPIAESVMYSFK